MDELFVATFKPAERKDITGTRSIVKLLESAAGSVEHRTDVQYLGRGEHQRWPEIDGGKQCGRVGGGRRGRRRGHLWSIQFSGDESQHLEPKQHQWIIRHVQLDLQLGRIKKRRLVTTTKEVICSIQDYRHSPAGFCYVCFMFVETSVKIYLLLLTNFKKCKNTEWGLCALYIMVVLLWELIFSLFWTKWVTWIPLNSHCVMFVNENWFYAWYLIAVSFFDIGLWIKCLWHWYWT